MTSTHVASGRKANINNPNTSEESKQHSKQVLDSGDFESASRSEGDKNPNNVAGGLKATINNPNNSEEANQSAKERLEGT
ncbi:hypothetical protein EJ07DRAFT_99080 [Lizonia empirigonia]|nr:hypothetical protein EJ07DRAFT_99080 [Lizonia empirigonia]